MDTVGGTALDMFVLHGLPWMGKKADEMGRYYGSEALRDPKLQKTSRSTWNVYSHENVVGK